MQLMIPNLRVLIHTLLIILLEMSIISMLNHLILLLLCLFLEKMPQLLLPISGLYMFYFAEVMDLLIIIFFI